MILAVALCALGGADGLLQGSNYHRVSCPLVVHIETDAWAGIRHLRPTLGCKKAGGPSAMETFTPATITSKSHQAWFHGRWTAPAAGLLTKDVLESCWVSIVDPTAGGRSVTVDERLYRFDLEGECKGPEPVRIRPAGPAPPPATAHRRVACPIVVEVSNAEWIANLQPRVACAGGGGTATAWHIAGAAVTGVEHTAWFHGHWTGSRSAPRPRTREVLGLCWLVSASGVPLRAGSYNINLLHQCGFAQ